MIHGILDKIKGNPHITGGTAYAILFTMGLCHLLNDMIQSVIPAIYPLLKENYGFTFAQIGVITLVFQMTSSVFQPFIGRYADRHPQPYFMAAGMGFMLLGLLALAYSTTFMLILASVAVIGCGFLGDRFGRKYVILVSILGAAPFTLAMPYLNLFWTVVMSVITGLVISSAFSAIVVYATDLKPDKVGMVAGIFFGLMFGLGGIRPANAE